MKNVIVQSLERIYEEDGGCIYGKSAGYRPGRALGEDKDRTGGGRVDA
jgi:hypothetical protein